RARGQFASALAEYQRGHALGSRQPDWRHPSARWVQETERLLELDSKLPDILAGRSKPGDLAEQLELARMCGSNKRMYAAAAQFYADVFAADPRVADALDPGHRYDADCAAARAAGGRRPGRPEGARPLAAASPDLAAGRPGPVGQAGPEQQPEGARVGGNHLEALVVRPRPGELACDERSRQVARRGRADVHQTVDRCGNGPQAG